MPKVSFLVSRMLLPMTIIFLVASLVVAAVICVPAIPRIVSKTYSSSTTHLTDRIVAKCTSGEPKEGALYLQATSIVTVLDTP
jgi:hypothetical protein